MKKNSETTCNDCVCSVDFAFRRIGGKYKGRILWHLGQNVKLRYGALRRIIEDATPKMLTQSLRQLEEDELVLRKAYKEIPPKVEYSLTEAGRELIPFITHLKLWGDKQKNKHSN